MPLEFQLLRPWWLLALLPMLVVLALLLRGQARSRAWSGLVDAHLLPYLLEGEAGRVRRWPLLVLAFGWLLAVLALAGPVWERLPQPVYQTEHYRVLVLDISASMNAEDQQPSRLAQARFEVLELLRQDAEGHTALLAFGAQPYLVSPLSTDTDTIAAQVPGLETALLPVQGAKRTDLALEMAADLLRQAGAREGEIILISDAPDNPARAAEAARTLSEAGYSVSVLGMGTPEGAPVPTDKGGFRRDDAGGISFSKRDDAALRLLAGEGGGIYVSASADDADIRALMPDLRQAEEESRQQDVQSDQWREEGPWLLLLLLPIAALGFRRGWMSPLLLVVFLAPAPPVQAFEWRDLWQRPDQRAAQAYEQGRHQEAAESFKRADWQAAARYRSGDYQGALDSLQNLKGSEADYNKGNALARIGDLEEAIAAYERVLQQNPQHEDARFNRDLLQQLMDQQQQQQQQQGEGQQQDQQQEAGQQDGDQQDQAGQQSGENDKQGRQRGTAIRRTVSGRAEGVRRRISRAECSAGRQRTGPGAGGRCVRGAGRTAGDVQPERSGYDR